MLLAECNGCELLGKKFVMVLKLKSHRCLALFPHWAWCSALRTAVVDRVLDRHAFTDFPSCSTEHLHLLFEMAQCFSAQCKTVSITTAASVDLSVSGAGLLGAEQKTRRNFGLPKPQEVSMDTCLSLGSLIQPLRRGDMHSVDQCAKGKSSGTR